MVKIQENKDWNDYIFLFRFLLISGLKSKKTRIEISSICAICSVFIMLKSKKTRIEISITEIFLIFSAQLKSKKTRIEISFICAIVNFFIS